MGCSRTVIVHYGDPSPTVALANQLAEFDTDVVVVANDRSTRPDTLGSHAVWQIPERNLGYGLAFMAAVRDCTSRACVVLNTDLVIDKRTFNRCLDVLFSAPDVGVVGPVLHYADGALQSGAGTFRRWRRAPSARTSPGRGPAECQWVTGAAMFIRLEVVRTVGMDGSFFLGSEDADLCLRATRAGWRVLCCGDAPATHYGGRVIAGPRWSYYATRNRIWFVRTHFGMLPSALNWLWSLALLPRVIVADVIKRRSLLSSRLTVMALMHAVWSKPDAAHGPLATEPIPARIMRW